MRQKKVQKREGKTAWIHAASAGEGNQAVPLAVLLKEKGYKIILSVFSASGYHFHKKNELFEEVVNLPLDLKSNAQTFISAINPDLAIFIRNELWQNYLTELNAQNIPSFLVNTPDHVLAPKNSMLKGYVHRCLKTFTNIYPESGRTAGQLLSNISNIQGNTKIEAAVKAVAGQEDKVLKSFIGDQLCIVGGSTWMKEETFLQRWIDENPAQSVKVIIAPHEINQARIISVKSTLDDYCMYSRYNDLEDQMKVMILDEYGVLKNAYPLADIAFIGGGFGKGLHNTLEAAVHGLPVIAGPKHGKFAEITDLEELGALTTVRNYAEFKSAMDALVASAEKRNSIAESLKQYSEQQLGTSDRIVADILANVD